MLQVQIKTNAALAGAGLLAFVAGAGCGSASGDEPDASEVPDADASAGGDARAEADASPPQAEFRFPASATAFCTDGEEETPCPSSGDFEGQDGDYRIDVPAYDTAFQEMLVVDQMTQLAWTRVPHESRSVDAAVEYCEDVAENAIGSRDDWRLPTRFELLTLVDFGRYDPALPDLYEDFLEEGAQTWTETPGAADPGATWIIFTSTGEFAILPDTDQDLHLQILCVSGEIPSQELESEGDTVRDTRSGLVWEASSSGDDLSWENALSRCEGLSLEDHDDWRLPSAKELNSIVDDESVEPAFDGRFDEPVAEELWTSTPLPPEPDRVHTIEVEDGTGTTKDLAEDTAGARCVRGPE